MKTTKGFTLVEVVIALGIAAFLVSVTLSLNLNIFKNIMFTSTRSTLSHDNLLLANYLRGQVQGIGGGSLLSWMSVWVEDGQSGQCNSRGDLPTCSDAVGPSDRITLVTEVPNKPECTIFNSAAFPVLGMNNAPCCIDASWKGTQVMLVQGMTYYSSAFVTAADPLTCQLTVVPGQASLNDYPEVPASNWVGTLLQPGIVARVSVATYFMTFTAGVAKNGGATWKANNLLSWSDLDGDGFIESSELNIIADNIYDFQGALGIDSSRNSIIVDKGTTNDQWLYNALDTWLTPPFAALTAPKTAYIREVGIGILSGVPNNFNQAQPGVIPAIFNGPQRTSPGVQVRSIIMKATPRNNLIYQ